MILAVMTDSIQGADLHKPDPATYNNPTMKAIAYGIAAPNPHNTQSWFVDTLGNGDMLLFAKHVLPATDPPARQIFIGAGCFIESMRIGMSAEGFQTEVEFLPEGNATMSPGKLSSKPLAKITLVKNDETVKDILYDFIYERQSNRRPYKGKMITENEFATIKELVGPTHAEMIFITGESAIAPYLDFFSKALAIETRTNATNEETRKLFRFSESQREEKKDGLCLQTQGMDGLLGNFVERWILKSGDSTTWHSKQSFKSTMKTIDKAIYSAKGVVMFKTATNDQIDWLKTGRDFLRYNLVVAKLGLATSHYNQVIQEYSEMQPLQKEFDALTGTGGDGKIQLILRIGRAKPVPYTSWRKDVDSFIVPG